MGKFSGPFHMAWKAETGHPHQHYLKLSQILLRAMGENITGLNPDPINRPGTPAIFYLIRPFLNLAMLKNVWSGGLNGGRPTFAISEAPSESTGCAMNLAVYAPEAARL